jgi:flagellar motor switch protein FliN/FliY
MPAGDLNADDHPSQGRTGDAARISEGVERMFDATEAALAALAPPTHAATPRSFEFPDFMGSLAGMPSALSVDEGPVEANLRIEMGRAEVSRDEMLGLRSGAVVPLDKLANDPADVYVNGRLVARGNVMVLDEKFCIRITELVANVACD